MIKCSLIYNLILNNITTLYFIKLTLLAEYMYIYQHFASSEKSYTHVTRLASTVRIEPRQEKMLCCFKLNQPFQTDSDAV